MRRSNLQPITVIAAGGLLVALGLASCSQTDAVVARETPAGPSFVSPDASALDAASQGTDVLMCPVTTCSDRWETCPTSAFPCDVNLLTDDNNCGGCGVRCGGERLNFSAWTCIDGKCTFGCSEPFRNCDKDPTNGCEVDSDHDAANCGACGRKCAEGEYCNRGNCIGKCPDPNAQDICNDRCTNLDSDDANCGACGIACDPAGPNKPALHPSMYYGCGGGKCGVRKCRGIHQRDCNDDLSDGCEANVLTNERCGSCDRRCAEGKLCQYQPPNKYYCMCADGYERCPSSLYSMTCEDLIRDPENCGGCGHVCPGKQWPHFVPTCNSGVCGGVCEEPYADCDRLSENGCEINTRIDNRNCGACGNACLPDQVCSEGKCLVAPCDAGVTTK
jgi:hypothetical protein